MSRKPITNAEELLAWREKHELTQKEACAVFHRGKRAYQILESGRLKDFPTAIDDLAQLYEIKHRKKKRKGAATA